MDPVSSESLRDRLRRALTAAMKARDTSRVAALRSALAAIDNAEAVDPAPAQSGAEHPQIAGSVGGVGAAEVARRSLTQAQMESILRAEIADRHAAARTYEHARQPDLADRLRAEADVLTSFLDPGGQPSNPTPPPHTTGE
jgi:uncharacterized protein YqeY